MVQFKTFEELDRYVTNARSACPDITVAEAKFIESQLKETHFYSFAPGELRTKKSFWESWDKKVIRRAAYWANIAPPNLAVRYACGKIINVRSYADSWGWEGDETGMTVITEMHKVAKYFVGKPLDGIALKLLSEGMREAYHTEFRKEKWPYTYYDKRHAGQ